MTKSIFFTILMLFMLIIFMVGIDQYAIKEISADEAIGAELSSIKLNARLYFVFGDSLHSEDRIIEFFDKDYVGGLANELEIGPKNKIYDSTFDSKVHIRSVELHNRTAFVDLSSNARYSSLWKDDRAELFIWAIVNTFTEHSDISSVKFLIDGEDMDMQVGSISMLEPLERNIDYIYVKQPHPSDVVIEFLDNIYMKRFDIAYEQIDTESRLMIRYKDFVQMMEDYYRNFYNYQRGVYFTRDFQDTKVVHVKYILYETVQNPDGNVVTESANAIFDDWILIKEDDEWKIDLKRR